MYLTQGLHHSLQRHPTKMALTHLGAQHIRSHRFDGLLDNVERQAAALAAHGVRAKPAARTLGRNPACFCRTARAGR